MWRCRGVEDLSCYVFGDYRGIIYNSRASCIYLSIYPCEGPALVYTTQQRQSHRGRNTHTPTPRYDKPL